MNRQHMFFNAFFSLDTYTLSVQNGQSAHLEYATTRAIKY